jgi:hypothetical protein
VTFEAVRRVELSGTIPAAEITRLLPVGVTDLGADPRLGDRRRRRRAASRRA